MAYSTCKRWGDRKTPYSILLYLGTCTACFKKRTLSMIYKHKVARKQNARLRKQYDHTTDDVMMV